MKKKYIEEQQLRGYSPFSAMAMFNDLTIEHQDKALACREKARLELSPKKCISLLQRASIETIKKECFMEASKILGEHINKSGIG
jgi:hypothetical protein